MLPLRLVAGRKQQTKLLVHKNAVVFLRQKKDFILNTA
jgi:hypothetical protein